MPKGGRVRENRTAARVSNSSPIQRPLLITLQKEEHIKYYNLLRRETRKGQNSERKLHDSHISQMHVLHSQMQANNR